MSSKVVGRCTNGVLTCEHSKTPPYALSETPPEDPVLSDDVEHHYSTVPVVIKSSAYSEKLKHKFPKNHLTKEVKIDPEFCNLHGYSALRSDSSYASPISDESFNSPQTNLPSDLTSPFPSEKCVDDDGYELPASPNQKLGILDKFQTVTCREKYIQFEDDSLDFNDCGKPPKRDQRYWLDCFVMTQQSESSQLFNWELSPLLYIKQKNLDSNFNLNMKSSLEQSALWEFTIPKVEICTQF